MILASGSKRREKMLRELGFEFEVKVASIDERPLMVPPPHRAVMRIAAEKARAVEGELVVAADTAVWFQGKVVGKPRTLEEAEHMLRSFSGKWHEVYTGVAIKTPRGIKSFYEATKIKFRELGEDEIKEYVRTQPVMEYAGAYCLQGYGASFAERIEGDFWAVQGLPLAKLVPLLRKIAPPDLEKSEKY